MAAALPRVVLDTNVVVSSFWGGPPGKILDAWLQERYTLLISPSILAEYQAVLERLLPGSDATARFLHAVYLRAVSMHPKESIHAIRQDSSDNRFLECAVEGRARYIVSGDRHLLQLKRFRRISILTPRAFLNLLG